MEVFQAEERDDTNPEGEVGQIFSRIGWKDRMVEIQRMKEAKGGEIREEMEEAD